MTVQNDVVWSEIQMPVQADSGNSGNSGASEKDPARSPEQAIKPEKVPETPETPVIVDPEESAAAALERAVNRLGRTFIPPDIVRHNRPSLLRVIAYTWAGDWGPQKGVIRTLGKIDAIILGIPGVAILYYAAWVWERPARRAAAAVLTVAIIWLLKSLGWM